MQVKERITLQEFDDFVKLPENADRLFEYIDGEIWEVPSNPKASEFSGVMYAKLFAFVYPQKLGRLTSEAGGYMVSGERYAPDVAFVSKQKQADFPHEGYNPNPPDLAVEVDLPSTPESQKRLFTKVVNYLAAGTLVWVIIPETKTIEVYAPNQPKRTLMINDALDGGNVLPGFRLPIRDIFEEIDGE